jgi:hypothetical protein
MNGGGATAPARNTVRIRTASVDEIDAWRYLPAGDGPHPAVVMAHGIGAIKAGGLEPFVQRFRQAGIAAMVFDYRQWGDSDGQPREELSFPRQLEDYCIVIGWAGTQPSIDDRRIFAWGTSFAGMYVVELAATDARLAGAIAQSPVVDGLAAAMLAPPTRRLRLLAAAVLDRLGAVFGRDPRYLPGAGAPGQLAIGATPDALFGQELMTPKGSTPWHTKSRRGRCSAFPGTGPYDAPPTSAALSCLSSPSTTRWRRRARRYASPTKPNAAKYTAAAVDITTSTREARASTTSLESSSNSCADTPKWPNDNRSRRHLEPPEGHTAGLTAVYSARSDRATSEESGVSPVRPRRPPSGHLASKARETTDMVNLLAPSCHRIRQRNPIQHNRREANHGNAATGTR